MTSGAEAGGFADESRAILLSNGVGMCMIGLAELALRIYNQVA